MTAEEKLEVLRGFVEKIRDLEKPDFEFGKYRAVDREEAIQDMEDTEDLGDVTIRAITDFKRALPNSKFFVESAMVVDLIDDLKDKAWHILMDVTD